MLKVNDIHTDTYKYNIYKIFSNKNVNYRKIGRIVIDNVENHLNYRKMDRIRDYEILKSEGHVIKFLFNGMLLKDGINVNLRLVCSY